MVVVYGIYRIIKDSTGVSYDYLTSDRVYQDRSKCQEDLDDLTKVVKNHDYVIKPIKLL